jgi:hypothetical protein
MGAGQRHCSFRFRKGNPMFMWEAWEKKQLENETLDTE